MTAKAERLANYYSGWGHYHEGGRGRTDFVLSDGVHPMSQGWKKYHPTEETILVRNIDGKVVELTPTQHRLMTAVRTLEGQKVTATIIAASLGLAISTVTRGLVILAALKLVAYDTEMGRRGGITFLAMAWADLKRRSRTAWAKVQQQKVKVWDRYVRKLEASHYFTAGLNFATSNVMDANFPSGA